MNLSFDASSVVGKGVDRVLSPESCFLIPLFKQLENYSVSYVVLRNFQSLPYSTCGSDVDILALPKERDLVRKIIEETIKMAGGVAIGFSESPGFLKVYVFGCCLPGNEKWWGVRLDVSFGLNYAGVAPIVDNNVVVSKCILHNTVRVLEEDLSAVLGVVKEALHNYVLPCRYLLQAKNAVSNSWDSLSESLAPMGGSSLMILRDLCLNNYQGRDIVVQCKLLKHSLLKHVFTRAPLIYLKSRFFFEFSKVLRFVKPPGLVIAVLGTDGVGKSTIIKEIGPVLSAATHGAFTVRHLRPGFMPPLSSLKIKKNQLNTESSSPHSSKPSGFGGSLFRVFYLLLDYVLGYWIFIRPLISKSPAIVLFDRYVYDMAIDPRRFRIGGFVKLIRCLTRFVPKPNIIVCLHGDPAVVYKRKQEISLIEVKRQTEALIEFARNETRAVLVPTNGSLEETKAKVLKVLVDYCSRRGHRGAVRGV